MKSFKERRAWHYGEPPVGSLFMYIGTDFFHFLLRFLRYPKILDSNYKGCIRRETAYRRRYYSNILKSEFPNKEEVDALFDINSILPHSQHPKMAQVYSFQNRTNDKTF
jgi:hypothetical protein